MDILRKSSRTKEKKLLWDLRLQTYEVQKNNKARWRVIERLHRKFLVSAVISAVVLVASLLAFFL